VSSFIILLPVNAIYQYTVVDIPLVVQTTFSETVVCGVVLEKHVHPEVKLKCHFLHMTEKSGLKICFWLLKELLILFIFFSEEELH